MGGLFLRFRDKEPRRVSLPRYARHRTFVSYRNASSTKSAASRSAREQTSSTLSSSRKLFKPRQSASEFALFSASRSSIESDCAPKNRDCGYRAALASSTSFEAAKPCLSRFRKLLPTPSNRFRLRLHRACHQRRSSRCCRLKFETPNIYFHLFRI